MADPREHRSFQRPHHRVARVLSRVPLRYTDGADPALDRPAVVRAGSGLTWLGERLLIAQDDASFIAVHELHTGRTDAVALPRGAGGRRVFEDAQGNKAAKLDLEAMTTLSTTPPRALAFGSGSTPARETIVQVDAQLQVTAIPAPRLYAALRALEAFAGSELNIEGATEVGGRVRLFNRGNGAPTAGRRPVDASVDLEASALMAFLLAPDHAPVPELLAPTAYTLGTLGDVRLTFSDAATRAGEVFFLAAAEASADAIQDGEVKGSVFGVLDPEGRARWIPIVDEVGALLLHKPEGLCLDPRREDRVYLVTDRDDPNEAAELLVVELAG
jgi:hypothetical protein